MLLELILVFFPKYLLQREGVVRILSHIIHCLWIPQGAKPFRIVLDSDGKEQGFVTTEDGTGIVHTAPAFGADDFKVGKKNNLGILTLVDKRGKFLPDVKDDIFLYGDEYVKEDYLTDSEKAIEYSKQKEILESNNKELILKFDSNNYNKENIDNEKE